jgi:hypothetical protein
VKAVFGILSLVIVLAVIGTLAKKQLQAVGVTNVAPAVGAASAAQAATVPQQARALEDKARADTVRALQQGAQRTDAAER